MTQVVIENSVINSPFAEPTRHFRFGEQGITNELVEGRRASSYFVPIAQPRKKGQKSFFETEWVEERIQENQLINDIRVRVARWRQGGYLGVPGSDESVEHGEYNSEDCDTRRGEMTDVVPLFDPVDVPRLQMLAQLTPGGRIRLMLHARELAVGLMRGRLRRCYPDLTPREINLKLLEELDHAADRQPRSGFIPGHSADA